MKVGTLTFPNSPSHGAALQMFALYTALKRKGVDVEVINYVSDKVIHKVNRKAERRSQWKNAVSALFLKDSQKAFEAFERQIELYPSAPLATTEEITSIAQRYDRIIVGSDQVWNPVVTGNDMNFYLEFCDDNRKKASYAPSFGVDHVAEADKEKISKLLSEITYLSVREERGREIIEALTGRDVPVVLDPTFLLERETWREVKKPSGAKGKYVFLFTIKPSHALRQAAQRCADAQGCQFVYISGGLHGVLEKYNPNKHPVFGVGPAEFIDLIDQAECVFTNSFHGTAFSIILNRKFYVEFSSDTNSRLATIVKSFGLENCIIDCDSFDSSFPNIDYSQVNAVLQTKRNDAMSYLEEIIN